MYPTPTEKGEKEREAWDEWEKRYKEWQNKTDMEEIVKVTIKLDSAMSEVKGIVEIEAPIHKLDEIAEKLTDYDSRVKEQIDRQIGRPTLEEVYGEVREE